MGSTDTVRTRMFLGEIVAWQPTALIHAFREGTSAFVKAPCVKAQPRDWRCNRSFSWDCIGLNFPPMCSVFCKEEP